MTEALRLSTRPSNQPGTGNAARTSDHSASVMSDGYRGSRLGRLLAFPYRWARQSHDREGELDDAMDSTKDPNTRAS
ncbi:hypothetical protein ACWGLI_14885 [Kitasatospora sp. NPDC054769]|uniref:hypothetical protein n=1 Tax=Kitasatospora sp. NBC_01519 TaxID=2903576 RepID=UPI002F90EAA5